MVATSLQMDCKIAPKLVPNLIFDAEALEKPLESLLGASWTLLERSWSALGRSYSALGAENTPTRAQDPPIKPEQVVGPESTVLSICLHLAVW